MGVADALEVWVGLCDIVGVGGSVEVGIGGKSLVLASQFSPLKAPANVKPPSLFCTTSQTLSLRVMFHCRFP